MNRLAIRDRVIQVYGYLGPESREAICSEIERLSNIEDDLWKRDMGCAAFRIRQAIDVLLVQETVVRKVDPARLS